MLVAQSSVIGCVFVLESHFVENSHWNCFKFHMFDSEHRLIVMDLSESLEHWGYI